MRCGKHLFHKWNKSWDNIDLTWFRFCQRCGKKQWYDRENHEWVDGLLPEL